VLFYPLAFESFDLGEYDLILSSSSAWAKGVKKRPGQRHICYCHTPMRFVWRFDDYVQREGWPAAVKLVLPFLLAPVKKWDLETVGGVDHYIANSRAVQQRIARIYGRQSDIINPPVETERFRPGPVDLDYFLVVSRLRPYKRLDLVVEVFNRLDIPLKIVGEGSDRRRLTALAKPNIEFLGRRSDQQLAALLAGCRALIFPGEEDFGIVPLEAMACGRPVIAFKAGGALETVVEGQTGLFFEKASADSLEQAVKNFLFTVWDKARIREHAVGFDKKVFQQKIGAFIKAKMKGA
jgi:glycosyltransferase involved in cell wall biosynthesis